MIPLAGIYFPSWALMGAIASWYIFLVGNPTGNLLQLFAVIISGGAIGIAIGIAVLFSVDCK